MEGMEPKRGAADVTTAENLKRLARMLDVGVPLSLRLNGRRVTLPDESSLSIDLERDARSGCVEVDIRWSLPSDRAVDGRPAEDRSNSVDQKCSRTPHIRLKALITAPSN